MGSARSRYNHDDKLGYSKDLAKDVIAEIRTDLDAFSDAEAAVLENHGYLLADIAVQKHVPQLLPTEIPGLNVPHPKRLPPQKSEEKEVRDALRDSSKRKFLARR